MKKVILTEEQAKKLVDKIVSEQYIEDDRYSQEVDCTISFRNGTTFKGHEIDWIDRVKFQVSFKFDIVVRSFGIDSIKVYDFQGPQAIPIEVIYFPEGSDDSTEEMVEVHLNWEEATSENDADIGWIGIDHEAELELRNDENGNLVAWGGPHFHTRSI